MKIAIIGSSGHWTYALKELNNHTVTGLCQGFEGEDMTGIQRLLSENGIKTDIYKDFSSLPCFEVAIINTRFDLNAFYTKECLKKNIYVFSEKPLALNVSELSEIEAIKTDAFVSCMFGITYEGWCLTLKEAMKNIGTVRMINGQKSYKLGTRPDFYKSKKTFGGIIPWVSIHAVHWIHFLTGLKFKSVSASASNIENSGYGDLETASVCSFVMENGALATVTSDYYRPQAATTWDDDRIRIVGTKGILEYKQGKVTLLNESGETELPLKPAKNIFAEFIKRISDGISGVSMEESLYVTKICLLADSSAQEKETVIL